MLFRFRLRSMDMGIIIGSLLTAAGTACALTCSLLLRRDLGPGRAFQWDSGGGGTDVAAEQGHWDEA